MIRKAISLLLMALAAATLPLRAQEEGSTATASPSSQKGLFGIGLALDVSGSINFDGYKTTYTGRDGSFSQRTSEEDLGVMANNPLSTQHNGDIRLGLRYSIPSSIFEVGVSGFYDWKNNLYADEIATRKSGNWAQPKYKWEHTNSFGVAALLRTNFYSYKGMSLFVDLEVPVQWGFNTLDRHEAINHATARSLTTGFTVIPGLAYNFTNFLQAYMRCNLLAFHYRYTLNRTYNYFDPIKGEATKKPFEVMKTEHHSANAKIVNVRSIRDLFDLNLGIALTF